MSEQPIFDQMEAFDIVTCYCNSCPKNCQVRFSIDYDGLPTKCLFDRRKKKMEWKVMPNVY